MVKARSILMIDIRRKKNKQKNKAKTTEGKKPDRKCSKQIPLSFRS